MLTLDDLLPEIKLHILRDIPDIPSLCSLTRACPSMHALYANARRQIFNRVTFNELVGRQIDLFTPRSLLQVKASGGVDINLRSALQSLYNQLIARKGPLTLDIDQCKALRRLEDVVLWDIKRSGEKWLKPRYTNLPGNDSGYWKEYKSYRVVYMGHPLERALWCQLVGAVCEVNTLQSFRQRLVKSGCMPSRILEVDRILASE